MVTTRRVLTSPRGDEDIKAPETPMSAGQLRQINKLAIDGEPALGGSGTLKRKRLVRSSLAATTTPSPSLANGRSTPLLNGAREPQADQNSNLFASPKQHHSPSQAHRLPSKYTAPTQETPQTNPSRPIAASEPARPPRRESHWFMPSDSSRESTPKADAPPLDAPHSPVVADKELEDGDNDNLRSLPSRTQSPVGDPVAQLLHSDKSRSRSSVAKRKSINTTLVTPKVEPKEVAASARLLSTVPRLPSERSTHEVSSMGSKASVAKPPVAAGPVASSAVPPQPDPAPQVREPKDLPQPITTPSVSAKKQRKPRARLTKTERELRKLGHPVNLDEMKAEPVDDNGVPTPAPTSATRYSTRRTGEASIPQFTTDSNPATIRALRHLTTDMVNSTSGQTSDPTPQQQEQRKDRRSTRIQNATVQREPRKQRTVTRPARPSSRLQCRIEPLPTERTVDVADHLLSVLAHAAHESRLANVLAGDARHAIMRDIRHEGWHARCSRLERELAVMRSWDVEPNGESDKENGTGDKPTNGPEAVPVADTVNGPKAQEEPAVITADTIVGTVELDESAQDHRCFSESTQGTYVTASDTGARSPIVSGVPNGEVSTTKKRSANAAGLGAQQHLSVSPAPPGMTNGHGHKKPKHTHSTENGVNSEKEHHSGHSEEQSDHDTPQDTTATNGEVNGDNHTTRVLSPNGALTGKAKGSKGKHRASSTGYTADLESEADITSMALGGSEI